ncbi:MAG TPA: hypothetical protein IAB12_05080 [Candidatus Ornithospirochaeta avicola]|uniref:Uncharacterized protein n=1 Tax=Candidatus Ornithospirochaeta avicola TaxID=2840896 RepID=A0A9D1PUI5_9SPIO|nr:hypothetical protein [Candidatus Ornithospirochaeta avicola]
MFRFHFAKKDESHATYGPTYLYRALCLSIAAVFFIGSIPSAIRNGISSSVLTLALAILFLFFSLYRDYWKACRDKEEIEYIFGFWPFLAKKKISTDDIKYVKVSYFRRGRKEMTRISLVLSKGNEITLEAISSRKSRGKSEANAYLFASFCSIALKTEGSSSFTRKI